MPNFITLTGVSHTGKESDSKFSIEVRNIMAIHDANSTDRKIRPEVNSVIDLINGGRFAVAQNRATILEMIKHSNLDAPTTTD